MNKDIKWDDACEICKSLHNGNCPSMKCFKKAYDKSGNPIIKI